MQFKMPKKPSKRATGGNPLSNFAPKNLYDNNAPTTGTRPLPDPTHLGDFMLMLLVYASKKVLHISPDMKVGALGVLVFFGSILCDFTPLPKFAWMRKDSFFNQYFVKLSWGWTLGLLIPYVVMTSFVYTIGNSKMVQKHLYRLVIGTCIWFSWTSLFVVIEQQTGFCSDYQFASKLSCIKNRSRWYGFDISGHTFLLMYCILIISEESTSMKNWERIGDMLRNNDEKLRNLTYFEKEHVSHLYKKFSLWIKINFAAMAALNILWEAMIFITVLYYHSMAQKVAAWGVAAGSWWICYRLLYKFPVSPGLPGDGIVRYMDK